MANASEVTWEHTWERKWRWENQDIFSLDLKGQFSSVHAVGRVRRREKRGDKMSLQRCDHGLWQLDHASIPLVSQKGEEELNKHSSKGMASIVQEVHHSVQASMCPLISLSIHPLFLPSRKPQGLLGEPLSVLCSFVMIPQTILFHCIYERH